MKIMNKFQKKLANRKKDNKGFSLVELIIVIAIMAILVGIVGTQVIPYINKSKQSKDQQLANSYSTAAVSAYSMLAGELSNANASYAIDVYADKSGTDDKGKLAAKIVELTGYEEFSNLQSKFSSKDAKDTTKTTKILVTINATDDEVDMTVSTGETVKVPAHSVRVEIPGSGVKGVSAEL